MATHNRHGWSSDLTDAPEIFEHIAKLTLGITQADSGAETEARLANMSGNPKEGTIEQT